MQWTGLLTIDLAWKRIKQVLFFLNSWFRISETVEGKYGGCTFTRFLGVHLYGGLNFSEHVRLLAGKLASVCYYLRIPSRYLDEMSLKCLYHTVFESRLWYGVMFEGNSTIAGKIFRIQRRALRYMFRMAFMNRVEVNLEKRIYWHWQLSIYRNH